MKVVVENRVEVEADITPEAIESYLGRTGYVNSYRSDVTSLWERPAIPCNDPDVDVWAIYVPMRVTYSDWAVEAAREIALLAERERRQPGDVLLDIAKEGSEFRGVLEGIERLEKKS